jgi:hypothetical protein
MDRIRKPWATLPLIEGISFLLAFDRFSPSQIRVSVNGAVVVEETVAELRALWEETSFQLDRLQAEPRCVAEEERGLRERIRPSYHLPATFPTTSVPREPGEGVCAEAWLPECIGLGAQSMRPGPALEKVPGKLGCRGNAETRPLLGGPTPRIAVLREEGSNGDREMVDAFHLAGFEVSRVTGRSEVLDLVLDCISSDISLLHLLGVGCDHAGPLLWGHWAGHIHRCGFCGWL